jgi:hypothetical protein
LSPWKAHQHISGTSKGSSPLYLPWPFNGRQSRLRCNQLSFLRLSREEFLARHHVIAALTRRCIRWRGRRGQGGVSLPRWPSALRIHIRQCPESLSPRCESSITTPSAFGRPFNCLAG